MLLSGEEIQKNLGGNIIIEPYHPSQLNPNSYNLRLSNELLVYDTDTLDMKANNPVRHLTIPDSGLLLEAEPWSIPRQSSLSPFWRGAPLWGGWAYLSMSPLGLAMWALQGTGPWRCSASTPL